MKKNFILIAVLCATAALAGACTNTVHGAGEDIERAGENIQDTVE